MKTKLDKPNSNTKLIVVHVTDKYKETQRYFIEIHNEKGNYNLPLEHYRFVALIDNLKLKASPERHIGSLTYTYYN